MKEDFFETDFGKAVAWIFWLGVIVFIIWGASSDGVESKSGIDQSSRGNPPASEPDDPYTTNDESNDQPVGYYGTDTKSVTTPHNGHSYELDVDYDDGEPSTIYFPKGGHVDVGDCSSSYGYTYCQDENGREWEFEE